MIINEVQFASELKDAFWSVFLLGAVVGFMPALFLYARYLIIKEDAPKIDLILDKLDQVK